MFSAHSYASAVIKRCESRDRLLFRSASRSTLNEFTVLQYNLPDTCDIVTTYIDMRCRSSNQTGGLPLEARRRAFCLRRRPIHPNLFELNKDRFQIRPTLSRRQEDKLNDSEVSKFISFGRLVQLLGLP